MPDINPLGLTSIATALVVCLFAFFLWKTAVPTPVTRRFSFLLLVEVVTVLTSSAGIPLLFNYQISAGRMELLTDLHHPGDVLMLVLYPIFVAYALPLKPLKVLTSIPGQLTLWTIGLLPLGWVILN